MNKLIPVSIVFATVLLGATLSYVTLDFAYPQVTFELKDGKYQSISLFPNEGTGTMEFTVSASTWFIQYEIESFDERSNLKITLMGEKSNGTLLMLRFNSKKKVIELSGSIATGKAKKNVWLLTSQNLVQPDLPPSTYRLKIDWKEIKFHIKILESQSPQIPFLMKMAI